VSLNSNPKVAIISFSNIHRDARVLRQVEYLSQHFSVTVIGYGHLDVVHSANVQMFPVQHPGGLGVMRKARTLFLLPLGRLLPEWSYEAWYWSKADHREAFSLLYRSDAQIIQANDWKALPVAIKASRESGSWVVLDLHEYSPLQFENRLYRRMIFNPMIDYFLRAYSSSISASVTVNETIAERYTSEYGIQPIVVMNAPKPAETLEPRPTSANHIRLVHHGAAARDRKLELMIEAIAYADERYTLHLILLGNQKYISKLKTLAQHLAPGRVFFHRPVRPAEVVGRISEFDIGIFILPFTSFSYMAALPNKFFDFVSAGLAVCVGPSPEMARLTRKFGFGLVTPSFEPVEVAKALNSLSTEDIDQMKLNAWKTRAILSADAEMAKLMNLYAELLERA
jgi:hypothetical protein